MSARGTVTVAVVLNRAPALVLTMLPAGTDVGPQEIEV